jgi:regulator of nonsense transcripts 1
VLVGDAKQLPPTVTSREALGAGLGVSLFERMERLGVVPDLLNVQYRYVFPPRSRRLFGLLGI